MIYNSLGKGTSPPCYQELLDECVWCEAHTIDIMMYFCSNFFCIRIWCRIQTL